MRELEIYNYLRLFGVYDEKLDSQEKEIIDDFFNTLKKRKIDLDVETDLYYFENVLREIFNLEMKKYSNGEVNFEIVDDYNTYAKFLCNRKQSNKGIIENTDMKIIVSRVNPAVPLLCANVKKRLYVGKEFIRLLYHEIEHYRNFKRLITNIPSLYNLRFAYDYIFTGSFFEDNSNRKEIYSINHDSFFIENQADIAGYEKIALLLDTYSIDSIKNCTVKKLNLYLSDIKESEYDCKVYDIDDYLNEKMDSFVSNHRELLSVFPILLKKYNPNGSKKSLSVLYRNMVSDLCMINAYKISDKDKRFLLNDMYNMYYYLMYYKLCFGNNKEINGLINLIGYENFVNLINQIRESYRQKRIYFGNLSNRKYELKCINDSELNYFKIRNKDIILSDKWALYYYDYYCRHVFVSPKISQEVQNLIVDYIYPLIPECGYFILKTGQKIKPDALINDYLISRLKDNMTRKEVLDVLKELVMSTREQVHMMELERINSNYQRVCITLDNILNKFDKNNKLLGGQTL